MLNLNDYSDSKSAIVRTDPKVIFRAVNGGAKVATLTFPIGIPLMKDGKAVMEADLKNGGERPAEVRINVNITREAEIERVLGLKLRFGDKVDVTGTYSYTPFTSTRDGSDQVTRNIDNAVIGNVVHVERNAANNSDLFDVPAKAAPVAPAASTAGKGGKTSKLDAENF